MEISWTQTALKQFQKALDYSRDKYGDSITEKFRVRVFETIEPLKKHPEKGVIEPLLAHKKYEYRFVLLLRYKILYRVGKEHIYIIRFFHTSQNPKKLIF